MHDIMQWIPVNNKYPRMDYHVFIEVSLQLSMLLWIFIRISLDFYGCPCIDLPWILDPGPTVINYIGKRSAVETLVFLKSIAGTMLSHG